MPMTVQFQYLHLGLQGLIDLCSEYASNHELSFNIKKTKVMCFKHKCLSHIHIPHFTLNGSKLELVSTQTYLSVFIDDNYMGNNDLWRQTKAIYSKGNVLVKKFSICNADVKEKLFKTYCSAFYCNALWSYFDTMSFKKLQGIFNRMFRKCFNLPCDQYFTDTFRIQH